MHRKETEPISVAVVKKQGRNPCSGERKWSDAQTGHGITLTKWGCRVGRNRKEKRKDREFKFIEE